MSTTLFGAPLVGKLFTPVMFVFTVLYIVMAVARWLQSDNTKLNDDPTASITETPKEKLEVIPEVSTEEAIKKKKKKIKKSCCGTKGGCCKTKKESVS